MSNIATGIALSGPLEISTKGQEAQLGAAKFGAEKRIEEQRRKEKQKAERDKEIKKNTSFDKQYDNALIQNMHEEDAAASIGDIVAGLSGDDANARVEAEKSLSSFKRKMKEREIMDKQMSEMLAMAKKADIDIEDPHTIGGFTYANALQALEDRRNWNPERLQEIAEKFNSSFFNLSIDENTGQPIIDFNPLGASSLNYDEEIFKGITPEEFAVEGRLKKYSLGNTEKEVADLFPTPDAVMRSTISVAQDPRAQATAFRRAYREAKAKNPDLSEAKFMEEGERLHQERIRAGERGLAPTFREEMINTQLEKAAEEALKRAGAQREVSAKTPAPKEAKPSTGAAIDSGKVAVHFAEGEIKDFQPWASDSDTGKNYNYMAVARITPKKSVSAKVDVKAGALMWDDQANQLRSLKDFEANVQGSPHEVVVMSDGKTKRPYIRYISNLEAESEDGGISLGRKSGDVFKGKKPESFYIPATETNIKTLATITETSPSDWNKLIKNLETQAKEGGSMPTTDAATGQPVMGGQGAAPAGPAQDNNTNANKFAKYGGTVRQAEKNIQGR